MPEITPLVAGNWKMNGTRANLAEIDALELDTEVEVLICPPSTLISDMVDRAPDGLDVGAQDCHFAASGAHTGDLRRHADRRVPARRRHGGEHGHRL